MRKRNNIISENFSELARITGISVDDLMLPVSTLRVGPVRSQELEKANIKCIGDIIQLDRDLFFHRVKIANSRSIGPQTFRYIWDRLECQFGIKAPVLSIQSSNRTNIDSISSKHPHPHELEEFLNPTFIDPHYIERFAQFAFKLQAEKAGQPVASDFRAGADTAQKWHIPRHFAYSSDNGIKGGGPDLACAEIEERFADITGLLKIVDCDRIPTINYYDLPSQDAAGASLYAYQLGNNRLRSYGVVNGVNCAPRIDERGKQSDNGGEAVYTGMLPNGAIVFGTGAHCFGLYRDAIENREVEFFRTGVATKGSQFRSRDFWTFVGTLIAINIPDEGAHLFADRHHTPSLEQRRELLKVMRFIETDKKLAPESIPLLQENGQPRILFEDIHGNLKLAIKWQQLGNGGLKEGDKVELTVKDKTVDAIVTMAPFSLPEGTIALSAGSARSPYELARPDNALVEIFQVGRRVADHFGITAEDLRRGTYVDIIDCSRGRSLDFRASRHIELARA